MTGRETVALRLFLPPSDHLPPVPGDRPRVVLQQHPAQHVNRRELAQPRRRCAVIDRRQQRVAVFGVGDRQLIPPGLGDRGPPGGHRRAVPAGEVSHADPAAPVRPGAPPPAPPARPARSPRPAPAGPAPPPPRPHGWSRCAACRPPFNQAGPGQPRQQRIQRHLVQAGPGHPGPELSQHRMVKARIIPGKPQQVLPVDPGPHRFGRLPVSEVLGPLQHGHQRQPRRRPARPAPVPERGREILIPQPLAQLIADQHRQRPRPLTPVLRLDRRRDLRIRLRRPQGARPARGYGYRAEDNRRDAMPGRRLRLPGPQARDVDPVTGIQGGDRSTGQEHHQQPSPGDRLYPVNGPSHRVAVKPTAPQQPPGPSLARPILLAHRQHLQPGRCGLALRLARASRCGLPQPARPAGSPQVTVGGPGRRAPARG